MTDKCKMAIHLSAAIAAVAASVAFGLVAQGQQPAKFSSPPAGAGVVGNWAHFLGPNYNGVPPLAEFDPKGIQQVWSHDLGPGCASVTIVDGKLYTMGNRNDQDVVYCLDPLTGKENWTIAYNCGLMANNYEGGPSSTPTVADGRLYTFSRNGQVRCLDAQRDGKSIWTASVEKWSPKGQWWGFADSPIVWEDRVFLNVTDKGLALNRETGEIVWSGHDAAASYATLLPLPKGNPVLGRPALVVQACQNLDVVDPDTGASLLGERPEWAKRRSNNNAVTPAIFQNSLLLMHGQHGLSRLSCNGGQWSEDWLCNDLIYNQWDWFTFNQQVIHNGHLFALAGRGTKASDRLMCVDLGTGQVKWQTPEPFGNLILAADKLITVTQSGEIAWGALDGIQYREAFRKKLLSGRYWAHPVLHDGRLYVRSNDGTLTCLRFESDADDLALILRRLKVEFTKPDPNSPRDARGPNSSRTSEWLSSLNADGHWPDINYEPPPAQTASSYANPTTPNRRSNAHLSRLVQMANAYAIAASPDHHSPKMLDGVERALKCWYKEHTVSDNWWDNTIGEPMQLSRILIPLEDVLPAELLRQGLSYYSCPTEVYPTYATGENLVWYAQQQVLRGALARSGKDIAAGSGAMQREIRLSAGEGIQRDFSFHQHGPQLYNGAYGRDFIVDTCKYATLLTGTRYAFTPEKLSLLADHFLEGSGHMIRGKVLDYSAFGRTLLRRDAAQGAAGFAEVCDQLAALLPDRAGELMALKKHIEGTGLPYSFLGNRYFWNSDFMTHQREAYYISVKMVSNRTVGTETIHAENMKGCYLPFGTTWIMRRGDEYKDILPVLDWGRLPGVTSPHTTTPPLRNVMQPESFVGGVSDGTYGAAALVFEETEPLPLTPRLNIFTQGRKAWFFFDREVVALGAGINSSRDEPVATTLNQTRLNGPVLIDGHSFEPGEAKVQQSSWVLHDEIGYVLLGPADASVKVGPQAGDSRPGGKARSNSPATESVFTLWIDHGVHPRDAQYAYAVLPGISAQQIAEWQAHPPVRVIANTTEQQAVINDQLGVAEIIFRTPGSVTPAAGLTVKVDRPCLVLLTKQGTSTRIAVSSPGGEFFTVHLSITTSQKEQSVTFELPSGDMAGKSQVLEVPVTW